VQANERVAQSSNHFRNFHPLVQSEQFSCGGLSKGGQREGKVLGNIEIDYPISVPLSDEEKLITTKLTRGGKEKDFLLSSFEGEE